MEPDTPGSAIFGSQQGYKDGSSPLVGRGWKAAGRDQLHPVPAVFGELRARA